MLLWYQTECWYEMVWCRVKLVKTATVTST